LWGRSTILSKGYGSSAWRSFGHDWLNKQRTADLVYETPSLRPAVQQTQQQQQIQSKKDE